MKRLMLCLVLAAAGSAGAVQRGELSPEAQKLLPPEDSIAIRLKNNTEVKGLLVRQNDQEIVIKTRIGTVVSETAYARANIAAIEGGDVCELIGKKLRDLAIREDREYTDAEYTLYLALFGEYVAKCGADTYADDAKAILTMLRNDYQKFKAGLRKVDKEWFPPVAAAVRRYDKDGERLEKARQTYPGVEQESFNGDPRIRQAYLELTTKRRDVARELPKIVTDRLPGLIRAKKYDEAVQEVNAFVHFFVSKVVQAEAGGGGSDLQKAFAGMDFSYLIRLQKQLMEAYRADYRPPPAVKLAENEVFIPGGYFLMGDDQADISKNTFPMHIVHVKPFIMDRYEVSNADYLRFLDHVQKTGDSSMEHPDAPPLKNHTPEGWKVGDVKGTNQPVCGIDWFDAYAYAKWTGKRLPTEAEWEFAARGLDGRTYTWGNTRDGKERINTPSGRAAIAASLGGDLTNSTPVFLPEVPWDAMRSLPKEALEAQIPAGHSTNSPFGVWHLCGNVAEWVADYYDPDYYKQGEYQDPQGPKAALTGQGHVVRGGSYLGDPSQDNVFWRGYPQSENHRKGLAGPADRPTVGLRCVRSVL